MSKIVLKSLRQLSYQGFFLGAGFLLASSASATPLGSVRTVGNVSPSAELKVVNRMELPKVGINELSKFFEDATRIAGDFNGDGVVDRRDLEFLFQNFSDEEPRRLNELHLEVVDNLGRTADSRHQTREAILQTLFVYGLTPEYHSPEDLRIFVCVERQDLVKNFLTHIQEQRSAGVDQQVVQNIWNMLKVVPCPTCIGPQNARALVVEDGYSRSFDEEGNPTVSEVCLTHLGQYDPDTGVYLSNNFSSEIDAFYLDGKYTEIRSFETLSSPVELTAPFLLPYKSADNEFLLDFFDDDLFAAEFPNLAKTNRSLWAAQVTMYHHITRYRREFFNNSFIDSLVLPSDIKTNLKYRQFRPDFLNGSGGPMVAAKPISGPFSGIIGTAQGSQSPENNTLALLHRDLGGTPINNRSMFGTAYDPTMIVGEYAGLKLFWMLGAPQLPIWLSGCAGQDWRNRVTGCMEDATNLVVAAWYTGESEIYKDRYYNIRHWCNEINGNNCELTSPSVACDFENTGEGMPCDRGVNVDNVFMFQELQQKYPPNTPDEQWLESRFMTASPGLFTYPFTTGNVGGWGGVYPQGQERTSLFFAGLFYDIAVEVGIGWKDASRLWFQKIHRITNPNINMRQYGQTILDAANDLWPEADFPILHEAIYQAIVSRGIPLDGVQYFWENLPPSIGEAVNFPGEPYPNTLNNMFGLQIPPFELARRFGTQHPRSQYLSSGGAPVQAHVPGGGSLRLSTYQEEPGDYEYMAYTFYKHSKLGPADDVVFSDGTFNLSVPNTSPEFVSYNGDGSFYVPFVGRKMSNVTMLVPMNAQNSRKINHAERFRHCYTEEQCSVFQDASPFGFRVIQAMKNGFSFTSSKLGGRLYRLTIEDPSLLMTGSRSGAADYDWQVLDKQGNSLPIFVETQTVGGNQILGYSIRVSLPVNEAIEVSVTRNRAGYDPDTLTKVERANDLDRDTGNGVGRALVRNCIENQAPDGQCL